MSDHSHVMVVGKVRKRCKRGNEILKYQLRCNVANCKVTKEVCADCVCKREPKHPF